MAFLAQWLERAAVNRKVTGSIPVGSVLNFSPRKLGFEFLISFSVLVLIKKQLTKRLFGLVV